VKKHEFDERKYTAESEKINTSISESIAKGITAAKKSSVLSVSMKRAIEERAAMKKRSVWEMDDFEEEGGEEEEESSVQPLEKKRKKNTSPPSESSSSDYSFTSDAVASAITSANPDYEEDPSTIPLPSKKKNAKPAVDSSSTSTTTTTEPTTAREAFTTTLDWLKSEDYPLKAEDLEVRSRVGINVSLYESVDDLQEKHSADEIKNELQRLGLICGGRPEDRAQRLYLLKETPLSRLPKKLFAKKTGTASTIDSKRNSHHADSVEFPDAGIQVDLK